MQVIDSWLEHFIQGPPTLWLVLVISLALGLRHASDPDHLAAVTTLIAAEDDGPRVRRATFMGLSWGLGHALTLMILGLPIVLFNRFVPDVVGRMIEVGIGLMIVWLAGRLLWRWWRGHTHSHPTSVWHSHALTDCFHRLGHVVAKPGPTTQHKHPRATAGGAGSRTPVSAFFVGLMHGAGGTAGLTLLLIGRIPSQGEAVIALLLFACGTAISMSMLSTGFGVVLARGPLARRLNWTVPLLGGGTLIFGMLYLADAVSASGLR